ncbi:hypothetical protein ADUPG1_003483, partial [Aduncisulcus paluster]
SHSSVLDLSSPAPVCVHSQQVMHFVDEGSSIPLRVVPNSWGAVSQRISEINRRDKVVKEVKRREKEWRAFERKRDEAKIRAIKDETASLKGKKGCCRAKKTHDIPEVTAPVPSFFSLSRPSRRPWWSRIPFLSKVL